MHIMNKKLCMPILLRFKYQLKIDLFLYPHQLIINAPSSQLRYTYAPSSNNMECDTY